MSDDQAGEIVPFIEPIGGDHGAIQRMHMAVEFTVHGGRIVANGTDVCETMEPAGGGGLLYGIIISVASGGERTD